MIKIPAKVLIVDDEKDFVEMFSLRLKEGGGNRFYGLQRTGMPGKTGTGKY